MRRGFFYGEVEGLDSDLAWLAAHGWDAVISGDDPAFQAAARAHGLTPWACLGAFTPPSDDPALLCLDVNGDRQRWFGSGCPNHPAVRASSLERHRLAASRPDVAGVFLDGIRFASPASGLEAFCTCFCEHCLRAATDMGLNADRMQRDVTALYRRLIAGEPLTTAWLRSGLSGVDDWLRFRRQTITQFVRELADVVHAEGKHLGAYLFSPCLAPLVGQEYTDLAPYLDIVAPMLYRNVNELHCIAPINTELHAIAEWTAVDGPAWVLEFADLPGEEICGRNDLLARGVSPAAVGRETARANALITARTCLAPILWYDDPEAGSTVEEVLKNGASGIQVFRLMPGASERWTRAVEEIRHDEP
jgi:hypothetical protein